METKLHYPSAEPSKLPYQLIKQITNDFDKERVLGSGGFGTVYKGVHQNRGEIAVKVLHNISGLDDQEFDKEFNNLRGLKHQNIVELVGFCNESEDELAEFDGKQVTATRFHMALCFEYVHNGSLDKHISDESKGFNWHTRYGIIKGICEGLKYLREGLQSPIMHFDLKPENILLDKNMTPKIGDFGLSELFGKDNTTKAMRSVGTCGYWPPEYIKHQIISREFDIFSLGVIIVKIMVGHEGYNFIVEMPIRKSVKLVLKRWKKKLCETVSQASLDVYCNQVKRCIEIALDCLKSNRQERPTIQAIVSSLSKTERMTSDRGTQNEQFNQDNVYPTRPSDVCSTTINYGSSSVQNLEWVENHKKDASWLILTYFARLIISHEIGHGTRTVPIYTRNFSDVEPMAMPLGLLRYITDDFSQERLIGRSKYGAVYKGVCGDGQVIAVKKLHPVRRIGDEEFQKEIASLTKVHHQNTVRLLGYSYEQEETVVPCHGKHVVDTTTHVMMCAEYLPNGSLDDHIADMSSGLDWPTRYKLVKGISEGLKYLHEGLHSPVFHLDLKPANILLDKNMVPKITDFGISRLLGEGVVRRTLNPISTIGYMPPEFIGKQVISIKSDVFSLGVIMIELISGQRNNSKLYNMSSKKFTESIQKAWMERLQETENDTLVEIHHQQVKTCVEIALLCLDADRHKRPTVGEIVDVLNETETMIPQLGIDSNSELIDSEDTVLLQVCPLELCFVAAMSKLEGPRKKAMISSCLHLNNRGDDRVAFMLVPKGPKSYWQKKPVCGIVPPRSVYTLSLIMPKQPPSGDSGDFLTLYSAALGEYELRDVDKDDEYGNFFKEAQETAGDEVQMATLKVSCDQPAAAESAGTSPLPEPTQPTIKILTRPDAQQVSSIDVHPTEPWIMTTNHVGSLRVWNYQTMAMMNSFQVTQIEPVHSAKFIAQEKWLVAGDDNGDIHVYSCDQNQHVKSFEAHDSCIRTLAVHPTDSFILSSSSDDDDHLIKLWDWRNNWECTRIFQGHTNRVMQVTFNPEDKDSFASASWDGTVKIWSICSDDPNNIITLKLEEHVSESLLCVDYFTRLNRQHLIVGCKDRTAQICKLGMEGCVDKLEGHADCISAVSLHPEHPMLITGSLDGTVRVWNSTTYKLDSTTGFSLGAVYAFGCIKGSRRIVVGCHQGMVMVDISLPEDHHVSSTGIPWEVKIP